MGKVKKHNHKNRGSRNTKKLPNAGEAARQAAMLQRLRNVVSAAHSTDTEKLELQAALLGGIDVTTKDTNKKVDESNKKMDLMLLSMQKVTQAEEARERRSKEAEEGEATKQLKFDLVPPTAAPAAKAEAQAQAAANKKAAAAPPPPAAAAPPPPAVKAPTTAAVAAPDAAKTGPAKKQAVTVSAASGRAKHTAASSFRRSRRLKTPSVKVAERKHNSFNKHVANAKKGRAAKTEDVGEK